MTAFLVESRKKSKGEPQEYLLKQTLSVLQRSNIVLPISESLQPEPTLTQINGLWFSGLISVLGGVLANGWLAPYNHASRTKCVLGTYEPRRAWRAQQLRWKPIITAVPLLIQASIFLFYAGFIIQDLENNHKKYFYFIW